MVPEYMRYKASAFNQEEKSADFPCPNVYKQSLDLPWEALLGKVNAVPWSIYFATCP